MPGAVAIPRLTTATSNLPFGSSKPFCPRGAQFAPGCRSVSGRRRSWDGFMVGQAGGLRRLQSWHHLEPPCWDRLSLWALPPLHTGQQWGGLSGASFQDSARGPRPGSGSGGAGGTASRREGPLGERWSEPSALRPHGTARVVSPKADWVTVPPACSLPEPSMR